MEICTTIYSTISKDAKSFITLITLEKQLFDSFITFNSIIKNTNNK